MSDFADTWLTLRAEADARARDRGLVERLVAHLEARIAGEIGGDTLRILDIGAGNGNNLRALAPLLPGRQHWVLVDHDATLLERAGVPAGPINNVREMHQGPQTLAREMVARVGHSRVGEVQTLGMPIKLSRTPGGPGRGAPQLGEHTREVLREHGFTSDEIDALLREGAIAEP